MNKQDVINYVMETPENINPAILGQFLDEIGGGDEGEVWVTYLQEEDTEYIYGLRLICENESIVCRSGTTTTKTFVELTNFIEPTDETYRAKVKAYFVDFPNIEVDVVYRGSLRGWLCQWNDKYGDDYDCYCEGEIEEEEISIDCYYINNDDYNQIYPTKIELIVYKK